MIGADEITVLGQLAIGVVGGLVSTGVYLAYQRWITEHARWPYAVTHQELPDPAAPGNFKAKVSIRNRTTVSTQFLINLRLENGELRPPAACCSEETDRRAVEGWGTVLPGDAQAFEFSPGAYESPVVGVTLVAKAPSQREVREFGYDFARPFPPRALDAVACVG
ncbi:MAG: hypothetical protein L3J73_02075 [Thermoplasmata archaeon]|nr:hypothetical protein [Thermoplasmata archaeon]